MIFVAVSSQMKGIDLLDWTDRCCALRWAKWWWKCELKVLSHVITPGLAHRRAPWVVFCCQCCSVELLLLLLFLSVDLRWVVDLCLLRLPIFSICDIILTYSGRNPTGSYGWFAVNTCLPVYLCDITVCDSLASGVFVFWQLTSPWPATASRLPGLNERHSVSQNAAGVCPRRSSGRLLRSACCLWILPWWRCCCVTTWTAAVSDAAVVFTEMPNSV